MSDPQSSRETLLRAACQQLESLYAAGVRQLAKPHAAPSGASLLETTETTQPLTAACAQPQESNMPPTPARPSFEGPMHANPPLPLADRPAALEVIDREVRECKLCPQLVRNRTQTVFGVGNISPRICFFGEAPGADEDRKGEPFVGRAGQLLDKIIAAMTFQRSDVYILNVCKCRPPDNRTPLPDEAANCRPFWERQLEILRPEYVVCLGACAAQTMLQTKESIGKLRRRFHEYRGIKVVATYHPAYLLRNEGAKRDVWEDMKMLMREMGVEIPAG